MKDKDLFYNGSGYADPTAYTAIKNAEHSQSVENVNRLMLNRIELKDKNSGMVFK